MESPRRRENDSKDTMGGEGRIKLDENITGPTTDARTKQRPLVSRRNNPFAPRGRIPVRTSKQLGRSSLPVPTTDADKTTGNENRKKSAQGVKKRSSGQVTSITYNHDENVQTTKTTDRAEYTTKVTGPAENARAIKSTDHNEDSSGYISDECTDFGELVKAVRECAQEIKQFFDDPIIQESEPLPVDKPDKKFLKTAAQYVRRRGKSFPGAIVDPASNVNLVAKQRPLSYMDTHDSYEFPDPFPGKRSNIPRQRRPRGLESDPWDGESGSKLFDGNTVRRNRRSTGIFQDIPVDENNVRTKNSLISNSKASGSQGPAWPPPPKHDDDAEGVDNFSFKFPRKDWKAQQNDQRNRTRKRWTTDGNEDLLSPFSVERLNRRFPLTRNGYQPSFSSQSYNDGGPVEEFRFSDKFRSSQQTPRKLDSSNSNVTANNSPRRSVQLPPIGAREGGLSAGDLDREKTVNSLNKDVRRAFDTTRSYPQGN